LQWPVAQGGNGHFYRRIEAEVSFDQARAMAALQMFQSLPGHLVVFETPTYEQEVAFVHDQIYRRGVANHRVYWIGASRTWSEKEASLGWNWVDGQPVPPSIAGTWIIDFAEGPIREGACFFWAEAPQIGDYAASNPTDLASGYIVEFEPPEALEAL
jgi:hypothetical protein